MGISLALLDTNRIDPDNLFPQLLRHRHHGRLSFAKGIVRIVNNDHGVGFHYCLKVSVEAANNLDPYAYLTYIFTEAPKLAANNEAWVEPTLPQNAPDSCKAGNKGRGNV